MCKTCIALQGKVQLFYDGLQVLGVYADYYVFETTMKEQPEEDEETLGKRALCTVETDCTAPLY